MNLKGFSLRNNLPLPQRAENTIARNEWDGQREADAILVDLDWIMRSPSPVELYAPTCFAYEAIHSAFDATYGLQYEDTDIVMASPSRPTRSPSLEQVQESSEFYWCDEPPRSTTPALPEDSSVSAVKPPHSPASEEGSKPWGYSPWAETDASKFESTVSKVGRMMNLFNDS